MAFATLFTLFDDIAAVLDDVALMTKMAARKTAGVVGDDLALNANQVTGVKADRELPIVWAVAKGSFWNKVILIPAALLLSVFAPKLITPLLLIGGAYLCFEGVEKLLHKFLHHDDAPQQTALPDSLHSEQDKIRGAIRTDFILSAEIIAITLGTVAGQDFWTQLWVLVGISMLMTVGVYGLVAGIVKLDDAGLHLSQRASSAAQAVGRAILWLAPWLMKFLSIAGTAAMFLVGGGIVAHGIGPIHHLVQAWTAAAGGMGWLVEMLANAVVGIVTGGLVVAVVSLINKLRGKPAAAH